MMRTPLIVAVIACILSGGCSSLILAEKERALNESFTKGKIDKIQYLTSKNRLEREYK